MTTDTHAAATAHTSLDDLVMQRFPLLPRDKPVCRSLTDRIDRVRHRADLASQHTNEPLLHAAEAHNLAALVLSDCGMPAAARNLCWRQFNAFATSGPYDQATAKLALQPLTNLGRLHTRDGNGAAAYLLHHDLFQAAQTRTAAEIDGRSIDLGDIVQPGEAHRAIVQWLWTILLADGLRALCRAGRWSEAHRQAQQHHGIGERLLDGRQVAIIAHSATHDHPEAMRLVEATATPSDWEQAVAACMRVLCQTWAKQQTASATTAMLDAYLTVDAQPEHAVFHVRLGTTVANLAHNHDTQPIIQTVQRSAIDSADAYAAREALASRPALTASAERALHEIVRPAGLGTPMAPALLNRLMQSVRASETTVVRTLAAGT